MPNAVLFASEQDVLRLAPDRKEKVRRRSISRKFQAGPDPEHVASIPRLDGRPEQASVRSRHRLVGESQRERLGSFIANQDQRQQRQKQKQSRKHGHQGPLVGLERSENREERAGDPDGRNA